MDISVQAEASSHWDWLLTHITGGEVVDKHGPDEASGYGLDNVYYKLDKQYAPLNADSYVIPSRFISHPFC